jgi:hypothetical protein
MWLHNLKAVIQLKNSRDIYMSGILEAAFQY